MKPLPPFNGLAAAETEAGALVIYFSCNKTKISRPHPLKTQIRGKMSKAVFVVIEISWQSTVRPAWPAKSQHVLRNINLSCEISTCPRDIQGNQAEDASWARSIGTELFLKTTSTTTKQNNIKNNKTDIQQFFSPVLVPFLKIRLKLVQIRLWVLSFSPQWFVSMTSLTRPACVATVSNTSLSDEQMV